MPTAPKLDPATLEYVADTLERTGFPRAAWLLRNTLAAGHAAEASPEPSPPSEPSAPKE